MSMTPEESAHWQALARKEREDAIEQLATAAGAALRRTEVTRRRFWGLKEGIYYQFRLGHGYAAQLGDALEAYRRTEKP